MFGRRKNSGSADDTADEAREAEQVVDEQTESEPRRTNLPPAPRPDGPW
ncbi:DUF3710 domain-containing protein, partial [Streptomyces sp. SID7803]|nr:DUF3710 domain-containing protein [Streptomyces sp. SID7803]